MKKWTLFLLFLTLTHSAFAFLPSAKPRMLDVCLPLFHGGIEFGATALYLQPSYSELDFGLTFPNPTTEDGIYKAPSSSFDFGYQLNIGYQFPCTSNDVKLTYQDYTQSENDNIPLGFFFPIATTTSIELFNDIETFNKLEIKHRSLDLDFGQYINVDQYFTLRIIGGLRYAYIKNIIQGGVIDPNLVLQPAQTVLENQKSNFKGIGPHFGGEGTLHLGAGFGLVGSFTAGAIIGHTQSFIATTEIFSLESNFNSYQIEKTNRLAPNLEGKIGLKYHHQFRSCSSISLEGGYYINHYFDAIDWLSEEGLDQPELRTRHTIDVSFSGTYVSLQAVL